MTDELILHNGYLIAPADIAQLEAAVIEPVSRGVAVDGIAVRAGHPPPASRRDTSQPSQAVPTRVVALPTGPVRCVVAAWDPATSGKSRRDSFGRAVVEGYDDGVALVVAAGVMPLSDDRRQPLSMRSQAELAVAFHAELRRFYADTGRPDIPILHGVDGRGVGLSFLESFRLLAGPELARTSIIDMSATGQGRGHHWPPKKEERTRYLRWSFGTEMMIESTNAAIEGGRLLVSPNIPDLAQLLDERSRYMAVALPSGRVRFQAAGRGHDDRLTAVLLAGLIARNAVRPRGVNRLDSSSYARPIGGS